MPGWLTAGIWGLVAGSALVIGTAVAYWVRVPRRLIASVMGFGAGVLISALSFDLMADAYRRGGVVATSIGFLGGAVAYTIANWAISRRGAKHRKRSGRQQPSEAEAPGSGLAIAVGALLDGVPESIAIGVSLLGGGSVSLVAVAAIFLSNVPEGLSSTAGMKNAGRSAAYIFGVWIVIAVLSAIASLVGYVVFSRLPASFTAATVAVAAGAILTMLADTMVPEAFEEAHNIAGLVTVVGFLLAFMLSQATGSSSATASSSGGQALGFAPSRRMERVTDGTSSGSTAFPRNGLATTVRGARGCASAARRRGTPEARPLPPPSRCGHAHDERWQQLLTPTVSRLESAGRCSRHCRWD